MNPTTPARGRLLAAIAVLALGCAHPTSAIAQRDSSFRWLDSVIVPAGAARDSHTAKMLSNVRPGTASASEKERISWWNAGGPAYRWNQIAVDALLEAFVTMPLAGRHLALVQVAVDDAVRSAAAQRASATAAASMAASTVLAYLFPARAASFASLADEAIRSRVLSGADTVASASAGATIGQRIGEAAVARGKADGSDAKWGGSVPTGSGQWTGTNPVAPVSGQWKTWVLARNDEFRPPPPPAFDSERTRADLDELRKFQRTPMSNHRATYWEVYGGARVYAYWNELARTKLLEYGNRYDAAASARILAMLNAAIADAAIACWEAKYAYWYPRPSQVDAEFKSVFPSPNHPSYPSAHSCIAGAAETVLVRAFPRDRDYIVARAKEASEARLWAGIHYRFDIEAGAELGRRVAEKVLTRAGWSV